jgi:hypothetical protein
MFWGIVIVSFGPNDIKYRKVIFALTNATQKQNATRGGV